MTILSVSANRHAINSQHQRTQPQEEVSPGFSDRFLRQWRDEAPVGLSLATVAGAVAGVAVASTLGAVALTNLGQALALGGAAGAGLGLVGLGLVAAAKARQPAEPGPVAPPAAPEPVTPPLSPDQQLAEDLGQATQSLLQRGERLRGYLDTLDLYKKTLGRRGADQLREQSGVVRTDGTSWAQKQGERPSIHLLQTEEARQEAYRTLNLLTAEKVPTQQSGQRADNLVRETLGRLGRDALDSALLLSVHTDSEIARIRQALGERA